MTASRSKVEKLCLIHVIVLMLICIRIDNRFDIKHWTDIRYLNHTINPNLEGIPKFDNKYFIKFDTNIKLTTWIGQLSHKFNKLVHSNYASKWSVESL